MKKTKRNNPNQLQTDIEEIVVNWLPDLYFTDATFNKLDPKQLFPFVRFQLNPINSLTLIPENDTFRVRFNFQVGIWARFPKGCSDIDEVRDAAREQISIYQDYLIYIFHFLINAKYKYNYRVPNNFPYSISVIPSPKTEHELYGVVMNMTLDGDLLDFCCPALYANVENLYSEKYKRQLARQ